jgi:hypothetical protein
VRQGKISHFSLARLSKRFDSGNYITADGFLTVKTRFYEIMVQTGIPFISKSSLINYSDFNPEHLHDFFKVIGKETVTFPDLFSRLKEGD